MARYNVYELAGNKTQYVLDVQADILNHLKSVVVIPLLPKQDAEDEILDRLKPVIKIKDSEYVLITTDISAIPKDLLGEHISDIASDYATDITNALDFLFQGF